MKIWINFFFEYTLDGNKYFQLNQGTYNTFYNSNNPDIKIYIHLTIEESHYYTQEKKEENEIKEEKESPIEKKDSKTILDFDSLGEMLNIHPPTTNKEE